ncbi:MAG: HAD hydrolase family protein, partial [Bacteroidetes bacterium]|nr:HAD hydrolase family protein [Bacteroidota bacterium]
KPFLKIGDETFIEAAVKPFSRFMNHLDVIIFAVLKEHEEKFGVSNQLKSLFPKINHEVHLLENTTLGPAATARETINKMGLKGRIMICDSDHSIDIAPMFERIIKEPAIECLLPIWRFNGESVKNWSVASVQEKGLVSGIEEKQFPGTPGEFFGVIGCYYFADARVFCRYEDLSYISDTVSKMIEDRVPIHTVQIKNAEFFGDKKRLRKVRSEHQIYGGTIFCDLDGTLVKHEDVPMYDHPLEVLPDTIAKLNQWIEQGYKIIICTARSTEDENNLRNSMAKAGIPYHQLIMGVPSGPRHVINDRKPSELLVSQVSSQEIPRNLGIKNINLPSAFPTVLRRFKGASFSETLLVEDEEKLFVRKRASKRHNLSLGFIKLKSQYKTMERFHKISSEMVPALYKEHEDSMEYYYDMEYLAGHKSLSEYPSQEKLQALSHLLKTMKNNIYSIKSSHALSGNDWLLNHLSNKIYSKLDQLMEYRDFSQLINDKKLIIDGVEYFGLNKLLDYIVNTKLIDLLSPGFFSAVHGDLTLENILYYPPADIKLIDMDGGEYVDAPELDMGKMFQSIIARYEDWAHTNPTLFNHTENDDIVTAFKIEQPDNKLLELCMQKWSEILNNSAEEVYRKGLFYMSLHLIRMIPFRLKISKDQGKFALVNAIKWMNIAVVNN